MLSQILHDCILGICCSLVSFPQLCSRTLYIDVESAQMELWEGYQPTDLTCLTVQLNSVVTQRIAISAKVYTGTLKPDLQ